MVRFGSLHLSEMAMLLPAFDRSKSAHGSKNERRRGLSEIFVTELLPEKTGAIRPTCATGAMSGDEGNPALRRMGADKIHFGKRLLTVACNLEISDPLLFGEERKKETLDALLSPEASAPATAHTGLEQTNRMNPHEQIVIAADKIGKV
jgi:hypothetical protein